MSQDLFVTIKSHYNTFSRAEKHIADVILTHSSEVLYMTITQLAKTCEVGDTSVFRFCRHIGKNGYQDFKVDLAQAISNRDLAPALSDHIVTCSDPADIMVQKVLYNNIAALKETCSLLNFSVLSQTVTWLTEAEHICFFGVGDSSTSAMEAHNRFLRVSAKTEHIQDARMQLVRASLMKPQDVAVLFSYSGASKETVAVAQAAHDAGARTICVSRFSHSPLASICDLVYLCGGDEGPLQTGSQNVKASQSMLTEIIFIAFCQANEEECEEICHRCSSFMQWDKL
ncbi:MAG: MurR/RpiR family transcriptional regulator [Eubacteriales bacterium]|nr:MurR/RpiR family transcriptional regulator [Eubacteriales bacterium]